VIFSGILIPDYREEESIRPVKSCDQLEEWIDVQQQVVQNRRKPFLPPNSLVQNHPIHESF
jgi:hypothetical protein